MADYAIRFSCLLDAGSAKNAARALELYNEFATQDADEETPSDGFLLSIQPEHGGSTLWIRDDGAGDAAAVVAFVFTVLMLIFTLHGERAPSEQLTVKVALYLSGRTTPFMRETR